MYSVLRPVGNYPSPAIHSLFDVAQKNAGARPGRGVQNDARGVIRRIHVPGGSVLHAHRMDESVRVLRLQGLGPESPARAPPGRDIPTVQLNVEPPLACQIHENTIDRGVVPYFESGVNGVEVGGRHLVDPGCELPRLIVEQAREPGPDGKLPGQARLLNQKQEGGGQEDFYGAHAIPPCDRGHPRMEARP